MSTSSSGDAPLYSYRHCRRPEPDSCGDSCTSLEVRPRVALHWITLVWVWFIYLKLDICGVFIKISSKSTF